jgi:hypothetical protein
LEQRVILNDIREALGGNENHPDCYSSVFGRELNPSVKWLVEERVSRPALDKEDPLDHLVKAAPASIRKWMIRMANLADGSAAGQTLVDPAAIQDRIAVHRKANPTWKVTPSKKGKSGWLVLTAGLFRMISGIGIEEISRRIGCGESSVFRYLQDHGLLLQTNEEYAHHAEQITHESLKACYGDSRYRRA